ncbi:hypothetical protein [Asticcacaulis taihuensis]|uniref:hypothetical protein n=1 Tax=Asticcacaulis taihuensis TaxID=260084 RepID=UPI0026F27F6B|nr:hypothetical protein [Asticcacaulis taihuensis]
MTNINPLDTEPKQASAQPLDQLLLSTLDDLYMSIELHIPLRLRPLGLQSKLVKTAEVLQAAKAGLPAEHVRAFT